MQMRPTPCTRHHSLQLICEKAEWKVLSLFWDEERNEPAHRDSLEIERQIQVHAKGESRSQNRSSRRGTERRAGVPRATQPERLD
jgi:hypothetical protein